MRLDLCCLALLLGTAGCGTTGSGARVTPGSLGREAPASEPVRLRADDRPQGQVVFVNPGLRYVVMDFAFWRLPAMDQVLTVYRGAEKVGRVKITGPTMDTTLAGDLVSGEAQVGDEVREE